MKLKEIKVRNAIIILIAAVGLTVQVINISDRYFRFKTTTTITIDNPLSIQIPSLSTCWDLEETLNATQINLETNISYPTPEQIEDDWYLWYNATQHMVIEDFFKFTPSNTSILNRNTGCNARYPGKLAIEFPDPTAEECHEMFDIRKYIHRSMMCYLFTLKTTGQDLYAEEYSLSPESSGLIYRVNLNEKIFGDVDFYSMFLHGNETSKLYDSMFSPKRYYFLTPNVTYDLLNIDITFSSVTKTNLKSPYDTGCNDIPGYSSSAEYFFAQLRDKVMKEMGYVDSFTAIRENYPYPLLSVVDFKNKSLGLPNVRDIAPFCKSHYYVSRTMIGSGKQMKVGIFWPEDNSITVNHIADQALIDYIIYICSSIGIWFGLSFCSLIDLFNGVKKKGGETKSDINLDQNYDVRIRAMFRYFTILINQQNRKIR